MPGVHKNHLIIVGGYYGADIVPGGLRFLSEMIAIFSPVRRFNKVDFPDIWSPIIVTNPDLNAIFFLTSLSVSYINFASFIMLSLTLFPWFSESAPTN